MIAEITRLKGNNDASENPDDLVNSETKLLKMYEDLMSDAKRIIFEAVRASYEIEKGKGRLLSQKKDGKREIHRLNAKR